MNAIDCYWYCWIRSLVVFVFFFQCQVGVGVGFVSSVVQEVSEAECPNRELPAFAWVGGGVLMHEESSFSQTLRQYYSLRASWTLGKMFSSRSSSTSGFMVR